MHAAGKQRDLKFRQCINLQKIDWILVFIHHRNCHLRDNVYRHDSDSEEGIAQEEDGQREGENIDGSRIYTECARY